jgi:hypothetical protein
MSMNTLSSMRSWLGTPPVTRAKATVEAPSLAVECRTPALTLPHNVYASASAAESRSKPLAGMRADELAEAAGKALTADPLDTSGYLDWSECLPEVNRFLLDRPLIDQERFEMEWLVEDMMIAQSLCQSHPRPSVAITVENGVIIAAARTGHILGGGINCIALGIEHRAFTVALRASGVGEGMVDEINAGAVASLRGGVHLVERLRAVGFDVTRD